MTTHRSLITFEVITVPPELSVEHAHKLMLSRNVRHLPVVAGQRLAGIISDRDLLLVIGPGQGGNFLYPPKTVGEVMSLAPISADPRVTVSELAATMVASKIDAVPVVGAHNELVGLVTSTDLLRLLSEVPGEAQPALAFQVHRAADLAAQA